MTDASQAPPPDCITAVVCGEAVHASSNVPVPWWSVTKTVLAAASLVLVARGRLDLDTCVSGKAFTLRQLLQHRSGLADYGTLEAYHRAVAAGDAPWTVPDMLARAGADRLTGRPGAAFAYSNIGYLLVRRLIEEAWSAPVATAVTELVLAPLGISRTGFATSPQDVECTAWGNAGSYHPGWVYHGLLVGPASDAALLLHRLLAGELLPAPLLAAMCTPEEVVAPDPDRPWLSIGYGLGLGVCRAAGGLFAGHTGAGPGSVAAAYQRIDAPLSARRTGAVFAAGDSPGRVERAVCRLAG